MDKGVATSWVLYMPTLIGPLRAAARSLKGQLQNQSGLIVYLRKNIHTCGAALKKLKIHAAHKQIFIFLAAFPAERGQTMA